MGKQEIKQKIKEAVEQDPLRENIQSVSLFGSYVHGNFKDDSDVDVLIEFTPTAKIGFFKLAQIKRHMESYVDREVDLLTPEAISKYFRAEVLKEAEKIYERR
ncbi:MAG TPA: nucleotidyltransferase [Candidatus Moranbacteria bacterium]|nr:nucleotidyltransferase [Candidatus Moranbacteria bacterium]